MEISTKIRLSIVTAMAAFALTSCNNKQPNDTASETGSASAEQISKNGPKIAFVEVDSLMSQYNYCKEYSELMNKKSNNIRATLNNKARSLQEQAAQFQSKVRANAYTQEQAEQVQANLGKQQQDLQALNE